MRVTAFSLTAGLVLACTVSFISAASARDARCRIFQDNRLTLDRICDFEPDGRNGSYVLSAQGKRGMLVPGISTISVSVFRAGVAEVRGLTVDGINSRWGEARRSNNDRACWVGDGFSICVY